MPAHDTGTRTLPQKEQLNCTPLTLFDAEDHTRAGGSNIGCSCRGGRRKWTELHCEVFIPLHPRNLTTTSLEQHLPVQYNNTAETCRQCIK
jgi:hypothetical protein